MIREMMEPVKRPPIEKKAPKSARSILELTKIWENLNEKAKKIITGSTDEEFYSLMDKLVHSGAIRPKSAEEFRMLRIFYFEQKDKIDSKQVETATTKETTKDEEAPHSPEGKEGKKPNLLEEIQESGTTYYYCTLKDPSIINRADIEKKGPYEAWLNAAQNDLEGKKVRYPTKEEAEKLLKSMQNKDIPQTLACFINEENTYFYLSPDGQTKTKEGHIPSWAIEQVLAVVPDKN